ncbi:hypothetical protein ACJVDH_00430 [Pedobacter sp. AW1-32]|uniref:hypothetical protein n=1 Tax=Pedobacter sp. AW1-32 TaxID=3383026 RepID=UPI003FF03BC1
MSKEAKNQKHSIKYVKSQNTVAIGIDGVFGGVLPTSNISMNFYTESVNLPEEVILNVDPETGKVIGEEKSRGNYDSYTVREIVSSINIDLHTAKSFYVWLGNKIKELDSSQDQ